MTIYVFTDSEHDSTASEHVSIVSEQDTRWDVTRSFYDLGTKSNPNRPLARHKNRDKFKVIKEKPQKKSKRVLCAGLSRQAPGFTPVLPQSGIVESALHTTTVMKESATVPETAEVVIIPSTQDSLHSVSHDEEQQSSKGTMTEFAEAIPVSREVVILD